MPKIRVMVEVPEKCVFATNIGETLSCDPKGDFDDYGFPIQICDLFPCDKYKKITTKTENVVADGR